MTTKPEVYLGDGVYASMDQGMVKLRCAAPSERDVIFLEHSVLVNLFDFVARAALTGDGKNGQ